MSNSEGAGEEEEEEETEEFYESLDRILSSSCSSTSASDDDSTPGTHRRCHAHRHSSPPSLDVWIAAPAPVEERRRRLLEQLGLSHDLSLTRYTGFTVAVSGRELEMARSVPYDTYHSSSSTISIGRSRSDNSVDPSSSIDVNSLPVNQSKLPLAVQLRSASTDVIEVVDEFRERRAGEDPDDESKCVIKDLDNGTEFVVKESRVRELRTGRQLTMEEFELCVGRSPIVQELMRRQRSVDDSGSSMKGDMLGNNTALDGPCQTNVARTKKRSGWFKSIKSMGSGHRERRSSDERDTSSEKGGRRSSSATDDSQDGSTHTVQHGPEKAKVRYYGKSHREITGLYMNQEIQAHTGSIWSIKFSLDGRYLASAGEDCVIHIWEVSELVKKGDFFGERESNGSCNPFVAAVTNGSPEPGLGLGLGLGDMNHNHWEKKRRARGVGGRKSASLDHIMVPEHIVALSEKPICSFRGHSDDVLDLSWSKSQVILFHNVHTFIVLFFNSRGKYDVYAYLLSYQILLDVNGHILFCLNVVLVIIIYG
jgi:WD repeat-containing protein 44